MPDTTTPHTTTSADAPDETLTAGTTADPGDALGDAGKRALQALRHEVKDLRAELKKKNQVPEPASTAEHDASEETDSTSESATLADADAGQVATTDEDVKPTPPQFQGTADGGYRGKPAGPSQLTAYDLQSMTPRQVEQARRAGQLRNLLSGK